MGNPLSFRNVLRANGGLEVWQRGAGASASIAAAASTTAYAADRWYIKTERVVPRTFRRRQVLLPIRSFAPKCNATAARPAQPRTILPIHSTRMKFLRCAERSRAKFLACDRRRLVAVRTSRTVQARAGPSISTR